MDALYNYFVTGRNNTSMANLNWNYTGVPSLDELILDKIWTMPISMQEGTLIKSDLRMNELSSLIPEPRGLFSAP